MEVLDNLRYSADHEWVRVEGDVAYIGITDFAQHQLGDIVYVDINTVGDTLGSGDIFGSIEAVKTVADLFLPISGEVMDMNGELEQMPEMVNRQPYGAGWIVKVKMSNPAEVDALMDAAAYKAHIGA